MKKNLATLLLLSATLAQNINFVHAEQQHIDIFIENGADGGNGSIEAPFGNLTQARDYIRQLKKDGNYPENGVTVNLREGVYFLEEGLELTEEDSGTETGRVLYRSYLNEQVKLVGGVEISLSDFKEIEDKTVKQRLPVESRDKVICVNLKDYGLTSFDELPQTGHSTAYFKAPYSPKKANGEYVDVPYNSTPAMELIYNDEVMTLSRWPNEDYIRIGELIEIHAKEELAEQDVTYLPNIIKLEQSGTERLKNWGDENDIWAFAYWYYDWSDLTAKIGVDVNTGLVTVKSTLAHAPRVGQRIYFYNLLAELDVEKEWYLDRDTGILYFYPPSKTGKIVLTNMKTPFFDIKGAEYITIKGLEMSGTRNDGISIKDSKNINVELSVMSNTVERGFDAENVYDCKFISNHVYNTGAGGIRIVGGDNKALTPGNNLAENNYVHGYGRVSKAYSAAIGLEQGVGNIARNNKMCDSEQLAMRVVGADHLIENNEITNVLQTAADMGAIYLYREKHLRGTVIQNNWFHDIKSEGSTAVHGIQGIYFDELNDGATIKNNIFTNFEGDCVFVNGGRDHTTYNNIFYNCKGAQKISAIGMNSGYGYIDDNFFYERFPELTSGLYKTEPFLKYEHLSSVIEEKPKEPMYNKYDNNFVINCGYDFKWCEISSDKYDYLYNQNDITQSKEVDENIFADAKIGNFNIKDEYLDQFANGEAPDFKKMGMYTPWLARALKNETVSMAIGSPMTYKNFDMTYIDTSNTKVVPFIDNNKTYVPIRYIAEAFDGIVEYDDATSTAGINISGNIISIDNINDKVLLNGVEIDDAKPIVREGRTYLPVRAVAETMNKTVTWYDKGVVIISNDGEVIGQDEDNLIEELYRRLT